MEQYSTPSANRDYLQALTISDLMHEAHVLAARLPDCFPTPDRAWQWLRMAIEPMAFDIRSEDTLKGRMYVGYWANSPICSLPMFTQDRCNYEAIAQMMADFFNETYPRTLSASRWCITHIPLPCEVN